MNNPPTTGINLRFLAPDSRSALREELEKIDIDPVGLKIMLPKGEFHLAKVENITCAAANILKQEMLSRGGEVVISQFVYRLDQGSRTDALIMGTTAQFHALVPKLRMQPIANLLELAAGITQFLSPTKPGGVP